MIINALCSVSGIQRKQAEIVENYKGVNVVLLKEGQDIYALQIKESYYLYLGYANLTTCRSIIDRFEGEKLEDVAFREFENGVAKNSRTLSLGLAQYFGRTEDFNKVQDYNEAEDKSKAAERQRESEERQREAEKQRQELVNDAEERFKAGLEVNSEMFLELCKKHGIKVPIKTIGWCKKSMYSASKNSYRRNSSKNRQSTVIFDYIEQLEKKIG